MIGTAVLLGATHAHALSLGDIAVQSALGAPLEARIPLTTELPGELVNTLLVAIPGYWEQTKLGLSHPILADGMRTEVVIGDDGAVFVRISTGLAVKEPILSFLIEVSTPEARVIREYTVLLDPPGLVHARAVEPSQSGSGEVSLTRDTDSPSPRRRYGPVRVGESLSAIARAAYPELRTQVSLVSRLIFESNPSAFLGGDPDMIMAGSSLTLPTRAVIEEAARNSDEPRLDTQPVSLPTNEVAAGEGDLEHGPVRSGETLYGITRRQYGGRNLAAQARRIFELNPDAFINGDMNLLRVGVTLVLPPAESMRPMPEPADAPVEVEARVPVAGETSPPASVASAVIRADADRGIETPPSVDSDGSADSGTSSSAESGTNSSADSGMSPAVASSVEIESTVEVSAAELRAELIAVDVKLAEQQAENEALHQRLAVAEERIRALQAAIEGRAVEVESIKMRLADLGSALRTARPDNPGLSGAASQAGISPATGLDSRSGEAPATGSSNWLRGGISAVFFGIALAVLLGLSTLSVVWRWKVLRRDGGPIDWRDEAEGVQAARDRIERLRQLYANDESTAPEPADISRAPGKVVASSPTARAEQLAREAGVFLAYGDHERAERCITEAIDLEPSRVEHKEILLTLYEATGCLDEARELTREMLSRREELAERVPEQCEELVRKSA